MQELLCSLKTLPLLQLDHETKSEEAVFYTKDLHMSFVDSSASKENVSNQSSPNLNPANLFL